MRTARRVSAILVVFALTVFSADPWDKPPAQWTKKDVDKILRDSPWFRLISTPTTWARTGGEKFGISPTTGIKIGRRDGRGAASDDPYDPQNHEGYFILRWASAKIIREAKERELQLAGRKQPTHPSAAKAKDDELYEVELVWDLFARFPQATEAEAAEKSFLKPSRLGVEFQPKRVEYRRGTADVVISVVFFFPRKTAEGTPLIAESESRIDFVWRVGPSAITARFDPQKMVAREEKDF